MQDGWPSSSTACIREMFLWLAYRKRSVVALLLSGPEIISCCNLKANIHTVLVWPLFYTNNS